MTPRTQGHDEKWGPQGSGKRMRQLLNAELLQSQKLLANSKIRSERQPSSQHYILSRRLPTYIPSRDRELKSRDVDCHTLNLLGY